MAGARMYLALVTVAVLCFTTILAQTDLEITAVDQTSMANGNQAYLVIYQKCLDPYPDYVAIFDERILGTKGENIFYISPQLTVGAAYVQQNGYSQCNRSPTLPPRLSSSNIPMCSWLSKAHKHKW